MDMKPINRSIYTIVRYYFDGSYDCIWSSGHTLRDALKKCKELNNDYHKNYGIYIVENEQGKQYK